MSSDASSTKERIAEASYRVETVRDRAQRTLPWQVWERMLEIEFVDRGVAVGGQGVRVVLPAGDRGRRVLAGHPILDLLDAHAPAGDRGIGPQHGQAGLRLGQGRPAGDRDPRLDLHLLLRRIVHHRHPARLPPGLATRPGGKVGEYTLVRRGLP